MMMTMMRGRRRRMMMRRRRMRRRMMMMTRMMVIIIISPSTLRDSSFSLFVCSHGQVRERQLQLQQKQQQQQVASSATPVRDMLQSPPMAIASSSTVADIAGAGMMAAPSIGTPDADEVLVEAMKRGKSMSRLLEHKGASPLFWLLVRAFVPGHLAVAG